MLRTWLSPWGHESPAFGLIFNEAVKAGSLLLHLADEPGRRTLFVCSCLRPCQDVVGRESQKVGELRRGREVLKEAARFGESTRFNARSAKDVTEASHFFVNEAPDEGQSDG